MRSILRCVMAVFLSAGVCAVAQEPVRVAVVGLEHGHARGVFNNITKNSDVKLVAVVEADKELRGMYAKRFNLDPALFYDTMDQMFAAKTGANKPEVVLAYNAIAKHRDVVIKAAGQGVSAMVEKPLATTLDDAVAMRNASIKNHTQLLVNYETTWYSSNAEVLKQVASGKLGNLRKVVVHDGHEGPIEIGVGPEFGRWLTDPVLNGAGAMFDFGCYGADLLTVMMHGAAPLSVTAVSQTNKPQTYPKVEDDATVILKYKGSQGVLMPSWDWSFARKDMEVYGDGGYAVAIDPTAIRTRYKGQKTETLGTAPALAPEQATAFGYLVAVMRGKVKPVGDLSGLDTNMVVVQILDAARRSVKEGRTVMVTPLPAMR